MAWYTDHLIRMRGRLIKVSTRKGELQSAFVVKGASLNLKWGSRDFKRLEKLFYRSRDIQDEIEAFREFI